MMHETILSLVGSTPLVRINRLNPSSHRVIVAGKLEAQNPGGSIKDRVAMAMIEAAERSGELTPDKTIIEATSGNTGIGLAMVCAVKGYRLKLLMPSSASEERKRIMQAYGAEIVLTPGHLGTDGAIEESYRLAREEPEHYVLMDQFNNPASIEAHYRGTAQEIWDQTEGMVTHVVSCLGTSGTAMGLVGRLKELNPEIKIFAVEPYEGHRIQGLKNMRESYPPGIFDKSILDEIIHVEDEDAFSMCRRAAREEGLFIGMSSGAALAGALQVAQQLERGLVVAILPDGGSRYLSTPLFACQEHQGPALFDMKSLKPQSLDLGQRKAGFFTFGPGAEWPGDLECWRRIVVLDLLSRYLVARGNKVDFVVGVADLDDHSMFGAREAGIKREEFSNRLLSRITDLASSLNVDTATFLPASSNVEHMLVQCRGLLKQGMAYEKLRSLYYDVGRDGDYGSLCRMDMDKLSLGKTVDLDKYSKENPRDFTLLKRTTLQDLKLGNFFKTEWGNVRPSWHLQMAAAGFSLDAITLALAGAHQRFPHLENVRGIWAKAARKTAHVWAVSGPVDWEGEGVPLLGQLDFPWPVLRLWLLSAHYRKPLHYSAAILEMWTRNWRKIQDLAVELTLYTGPWGGDDRVMEQAIFDVKSGLSAAIEDDLSLHHFWPVLFVFCRTVQGLLAKGQVSPEALDACRKQLRSLDGILGVLDMAGLPLKEEEWPPEVVTLVDAREQSRKAKIFARADEIREELRSRGYVVEDTAQGPRVFRSRASSKQEAGSRKN
jgi:cystathionine beta-synthase